MTIDHSLLPKKLPACWREFYKMAFELNAEVLAIRAEAEAETAKQEVDPEPCK